MVTETSMEHPAFLLDPATALGALILIVSGLWFLTSSMKLGRRIVWFSPMLIAGTVIALW